jgi:hypothetical protein
LSCCHDYNIAFNENSECNKKPETRINILQTIVSIFDYVQNALKKGGKKIEENTCYKKVYEN